MIKKVLLGLIVLVLIAGGIGLIRKQNSVKEEVTSEIVLEPSKLLSDEGELIPPMKEAEKKAIDEIFANEGAEMAALKDVSGGQAVGTVWRHAGEKAFSLKIEVNGLMALEKGFYYEGWLVGGKGFFSIGRMGEEAGIGKLYYQQKEDKSEFRGVVVTLESEDGDAVPAEHIVEGSF